MTPSEELTAAADLIRDRAAAWETNRARKRHTWVDVSGFTSDEYEDEPLNSAQHWMRLVSPAVAPAIQEIFRQAARMYFLAEQEICPVSATDESALALARAVLGSVESSVVEGGGSR